MMEEFYITLGVTQQIKEEELSLRRLAVSRRRLPVADRNDDRRTAAAEAAEAVEPRRWSTRDAAAGRRRLVPPARMDASDDVEPQNSVRLQNVSQTCAVQR